MRFLMCSDGSTQAEQAIRLGASLAAGCKAQATLLGIAESPKDLPALREALERSLAGLRGQGREAELAIEAGEPVEQIRQCTLQKPYDLVVIGAVRKSTQGHFWLSSKAYRIIKAIQPPVLSVTGPGVPIRRVLLCSAGGRQTDAAVQAAGQLLKCSGAEVMLLHVGPELPAIYSGLPRVKETTEHVLNSRSELGQNLRRERDLLAAAGLEVQVRLRYGSVLREILAEIAGGGYELVVIGSALSRSLRTYALGDISREVVNRANCAVLVLRGAARPLERVRNLRSWWSRLAPR